LIKIAAEQGGRGGVFGKNKSTVKIKRAVFVLSTPGTWSERENGNRWFLGEGDALSPEK